MIASAVSAGDLVHALTGLPYESPLPAATVYVTPEAIEARIASSSVLSAGPPRLMFATAGRTALLVTQSTPAMMSPYEPVPAQSSTRTATS